MSKNEKDFDDIPFYKRSFDRIQTLRFSDPDKGHKKLREEGIWLFYEAIEASDLKMAHRLLDMGVFFDYDEKCKREEWLSRAWHKIARPCDEEKRIEFIDELNRMETCMCFSNEWEAMLGLAVALQDKALVWKYAKNGGRVRQWGKPGEKWTFHQLLHATQWEDVRNSYRNRCFFHDWKLEYELLLAEIVYDTMKRLTPITEDKARDKYQLLYKSADAELYFRPIMDSVSHAVWLECSYYGADSHPNFGPVCTGPSWERIIGMKVDSDLAGMFQPGELIGPALIDYALEFFGFGSGQICDKSIRRSFAAQLGHLYKKYPRTKEDEHKEK